MSFLSRSHRVIGFLIAIIVLLLSVTGILLNHTGSLQLGSKPIPAPLARLLYGVSLQQTEFSTGGSVLSERSGQLHVDQTPVAACRVLSGVLVAGELHVAVCRDSLVLLSPEFELIEHWYGDENLSGALQQVGQHGSDPQLLLIADEGGWRWQLNIDTLSLTPVEQAVEPDNVVVLNRETAEVAELTIERLLQDLHSGRAIGGWGVWLIDLSALGLIWLTVSGYLSWRARKKLLAMMSD